MKDAFILIFNDTLGSIGNCWVMAAMSSLPMEKDLFEKVVPTNQSFRGSKYTGKFTFRFWYYGKWKNVVVDDRLPALPYGKTFKLFLGRSEDVNEFWPALLEKAYAKLYGSYGALWGGFARDSLPDFSGGIVERFKLSDAPSDLFDIMKKAKQNGAFINCSTNLSKKPNAPKRDQEGIKKGLKGRHAYTITDVLEVVSVGRNKYELVRIRNPHGRNEWTGRWSDQSYQIKKWLSANERKKHNIVDDDNDGEFFMEMKDFLNFFYDVAICHLSNSLVRRSKKSTGLKGFGAHGSWKAGVSAGGNKPQNKSFAKNPRWKVTVKDNSQDTDKMATLIVTLMQKGYRSHQGRNKDAPSIGFLVYRWDGKEKVNSKFFRSRPWDANSGFSSRREVPMRLTLKPGTYLIVPCTSKVDQEAKFYLRYYAEK